MVADRPQGEKLWDSADAYEAYVGRWSRPVAREFVEWLAVPPRARWLDVGCGTGALTQTIFELSEPYKVKGVDRSEKLIEHMRERVTDRKASFEVADARSLPEETNRYDAVVSGLVLNFVPEPDKAIAEMVRVARPGGVVAAYVWDYAGEMQMMRHFWDAAVALNPEAAELDEGKRFPMCHPEPLTALFHGAGLLGVQVRAIDVPTRFKDFDDYWTPFLGGRAPAPDYAMSLSEEERGALRDRIRASLPIAGDGSIDLIARAWAVRGRKGGH